MGHIHSATMIESGRYFTVRIFCANSRPVITLPRCGGKSGSVKHGVIAALVVLSMLSAGACGTSTETKSVHSEQVSKATFKGHWPVIPESGVLTCYPSENARRGRGTRLAAGSHGRFSPN